MIHREYKNETKETINLANNFNTEITATAKNAIMESIDLQKSDELALIKIRSLKREIMKACVQDVKNHKLYICMITTGYEHSSNAILQCAINANYRVIISQNVNIRYSSHLLKSLHALSNLIILNPEQEMKEEERSEELNLVSFSDSMGENEIPKMMRDADIVHYNCDLTFGRFNLMMDTNKINILTGECTSINGPEGIGFMVVDNKGAKFLQHLSLNQQELPAGLYGGATSANKNTAIKLGGGVNISLAIGALDALRSAEINRQNKNNRIEAIRDYTIEQLISNMDAKVCAIDKVNEEKVCILNISSELPAFIILHLPKEACAVEKYLKKEGIEIIKYGENMIALSFGDCIMRYEIDIFIKHLKDMINDLHGASEEK